MELDGESPARPPQLKDQAVVSAERGCQRKAGSIAGQTLPPREPCSSVAFQQQAGEQLSCDTEAGQRH